MDIHFAIGQVASWRGYRPASECDQRDEPDSTRFHRNSLPKVTLVNRCTRHSRCHLTTRAPQPTRNASSNVRRPSLETESQFVFASIKRNAHARLGTLKRFAVHDGGPGT